MRARYIFTAALLIGGAQALGAQETRKFVPTLGLTVSTLSIDSGSAARSRVGDRAYGLQIDLNFLVKRHFLFGFDIGGQFLDDKATFTQNTTAGNKKSTASITYLSAMTGLRSGELGGAPINLGLNVGASVSIPRRGIDNCVDCQLDKLDIPGGAFVEPTLLIGRENLRFRLSDRLFPGGKGMNNVIAAGVELGFKKKAKK